MGILYHKYPQKASVFNGFWHLYHAQSSDGTMCLWLLYAQAFHEPAVLLRRDLLCFLAGPGPLKAPTFQALVQEQKSVSLPQQSLDAILSPAAEQKQRLGKRIQFILPLHNTGQSVDPTAEICIAKLCEH